MNRKITLHAPEPATPGTDDIFRAMKERRAYVDMTIEDFQALYAHACRIARDRLLFSVTAASVMRSPALCVRENDPISGVVAFLDRHGISGAPVLDERGRLAGIVSERDILRLLGANAETVMSLVRAVIEEECRLPERLEEAVATVMTRKVRTASPDTPLAGLADLLRRHGINRLPVLDGTGNVVGIVSRTDLVNAFGGL